MLNTDLHNKNQVLTKMTFEQFQKNCKKLNDGEDYSEEFLLSCYNSI